jgi:hypothetical protein
MKFNRKKFAMTEVDVDAVSLSTFPKKNCTIL